jgi:hypothetical protein
MQTPTKRGRKPKLKKSSDQYIDEIADAVLETDSEEVEDDPNILESLFDTAVEEPAEEEEEVEVVVKKKDPAKKKGKHFLNNKRFSILIQEYYDSGTDIPCDELADMIVILVDKMLTMPCFINYTKTQWGSDLLSDGYYKAYMTLKAQKFDPKQGTSAFSYFSQVVYHALLNRIKCEKKYNSQLEVYMNHVYDNVNYLHSENESDESVESY